MFFFLVVGAGEGWWPGFEAEDKANIKSLRTLEINLKKPSAAVSLGAQAHEVQPELLDVTRSGHFLSVLPNPATAGIWVFRPRPTSTHHRPYSRLVLAASGNCDSGVWPARATLPPRPSGQEPVLATTL